MRTRKTAPPPTLTRVPQTTEGDRSKTVRVVVWHPEASRVLLQNGEAPHLDVTRGSDLPDAVHRAWGIEAWTLHDGGLLMGREGTAQVQALTDAVPEGFSWGIAGVGPPPGAREWQRPGWPRRAREVLDAALRSAGLIGTGGLKPVHHHDLVAVLRAETDAGTVYLKASDTPREAAVTALLSHTLPDLLPPLLWSHTEAGAGRMVSASGGELLDGVAELGVWEQALQRLAQFQREADASALAALGCPAWPLGEMTERVDALLADAAALRGWGLEEEHIRALEEVRPTIRAALRELAALGLPDLPAHGDAHPRNALHGPRSSVWFDWSEAASGAHPFMDVGWFLAFTLHPAQEKLPVRAAHSDLEVRLAAAYLDALGCPEAGGLLLKSLPLALLHRAVVYDHHFRDWSGTIPGWRPTYVPFYLKQAVGELNRLT